MAAGVSSELGAGSAVLKVRLKAVFLLVCVSVVICSFDTKKSRWISTCQQVFTHFTLALRWPPISKSLVTGNKGAFLVRSCFPEGNCAVVAMFGCNHRCGGVDHTTCVTRRVKWGHLSSQSVIRCLFLHVQLFRKKKKSRRRRPTRTSFPGPGVKKYVPLWVSEQSVLQSVLG